MSATTETPILPTVTIRNRWNGKVIFEGQYASIKECVLAAIRSSCNLRGSDLRDSDLSGSNAQVSA